jgi:putative nucleotidyltransferase with HDIG domain
LERVIEMNQPAKEYEKLTNFLELVKDSEISSIRNIVSGIIKTINEPKSSAMDLKEIIQVDPPLTARLLSLANSAYYSPPKEILEIMNAIIWIGWDAIRELALSQKVCEIFNKDKSIEGYSRKSLWQHSLAVALLGKMIYRREFGERGENMYAAGLLHDIGLIIQDQFCHDEFKYALSESKREEKNVASVENEIFGYDHADLGKGIIESWNLPEELCVAIGNHHNHNENIQEFSRMAYTLYIADDLCQEKGIGYGHAPFGDKAVFNRCLGELGLKDYALNLLLEDIEEEISKMEDHGFF